MAVPWLGRWRSALLRSASVPNRNSLSARSVAEPNQPPLYNDLIHDPLSFSLHDQPMLPPISTSLIFLLSLSLYLCDTLAQDPTTPRYVTVLPTYHLYLRFSQMGPGIRYHRRDPLGFRWKNRPLQPILLYLCSKHQRSLSTRPQSILRPLNPPMAC